MDVVVPQVGEAVAEIRLVRWLKAKGDEVAKGEPLFELDTDKYVVEVEAVAAGRLARIIVPEGSEVEPLQVVAQIVPAGETATDVDVLPPAEAVAASAAADDTLFAEGGPAPVVAARERPAPATPKARRLARDLSVDLAAVTGTGRGGMVTGDDVERATASAAPTAPAEPPAGLSREWRTVGARMQRSKQTVPHFYLLVDADMAAAKQLRERCRTELGWPHAPTYTDLVVAAAAAAVARYPRVNVALVDGRLVRRRSVNIGIAVAADDGLLVPVVPEADRLGLRALSEQTRALGERARARRLTSANVAEKSMVVSNLGMHGIDAFLAIIDVPDPLILSVGRVGDRCIPIEGDIAVRPVCTLGLSVDHRVLDGVAGARFLALVREALEEPAQLLGGREQ